MINNKNMDPIKGFAGIMVIAAVVILIIGAGAYFVMQKSSVEKAGETSGNSESVGYVGVSVPEFNFSSSPLADLNASSLNVGMPRFSFGNIFSAPSVDADFSYKSNVEISIPSPKIDFDMSSIMTSKQTGQPSIPSGNNPSVPVTETPSAPVQGEQQGTVNAANCAQFSTMPGAQYCSAVSNANGKILCEQCKAAGF